MRSTIVAGAGGVTAALLGALCCAGPLLFVAFGVGASLASTFEPLRPVFGILMVAAFALGFRNVYRPSRAPLAHAGGTGAAGEPGGAACSIPRRRTRDAVVLWIAAVLAAILWTFPSWSLLLV